MEWAGSNGFWEKDVNNKTKFTQTDLSDRASHLTNLNLVNFHSYIFKGVFTILERGLAKFNRSDGGFYDDKWGEAKILFNRAHESYDDYPIANYRIDFIIEAYRSYCRLTCAGIEMKKVPLSLRDNEKIDFKIEFRTLKLKEGVRTLISLWINENVIFFNENVHDPFDGYLGVGTFNSKVVFESLEVCL